MTIKKISLSLISVALISSLTGCGSSSDSNSDNPSTSNPSTTTPATSTQKSVKVVDGYIIGATVCDANNVCATTDATGTATADFNLSTPLTATAGTMDTNNNQTADDAIISQPLQGVVGKSVISPMTDLIASGADADKLASVLGLTSTELLYADPIATNNVNLEKAFQLVYAAKVADATTNLVTTVNAHTSATTTETNTSSTSSALPDFGSNTATPTETTTPEENTTKTDTGSALPDFREVTTTTEAPTQTINIDALANMLLSATSNNATVVAFVQAIKDANTTSAGDLEVTIATAQANLIKTLTPTDFNVNLEKTDVDGATTEANATIADANSTITDANSTMADMNATTNTATNGSALPNFGDTPDTTTTSNDTTTSSEANTTTSSDTTASSSSSSDTGSALPNF